MTSTSAKTYEYLHFSEYLDGGSEKIAFLDWSALQQGIPPHSSYRFRANTLPTSQSKCEDQHDSSDDDIMLHSYSHICKQLLDQTAIRLDFPGGRHRASFRLILENGKSVIATRRADASRSYYESLVMRRLENCHAPTPKHYAYNGLVMIQEDLHGTRLSDALRNCTSEEHYSFLMEQALSSLLEIHHIAAKEGLAHAVPVLGCEPDWLIGLIDRTALIGNYLNIPCPTVPVNQLFNCLYLLKPSFVKWDSRPGNAMLDSDNNIKWFDWEHCCARNPIDDMAWLLCDDAVPNYENAEESLIDKFLPAFADGRNLDDARTYLEVFGVHHTCVRLGRLLDAKGSDSWEVYDNSLEVEAGLQLHTAISLCRRAAFWAKKNKMTRMLQDWFLEIESNLPKI
jgi:hypothetical protein